MFWAIFQSAIWTLLSWVFRQIIVKFMLYVALFLFVTEALNYLAQHLKFDVQGLGAAFNALPAGAGFFFMLTRLDVGLPIVLSAFVLRFCIRRIPIIG